MKRKGQVTVFIIVAVMIVAAIVLFFLLRGRQVIEIFKPTMLEPQGYIEKCVRDATSEAISIMLPQGGYITPTNYKLYENNKVAYLCYNENYYESCINQEPVYIKHLESEIKKYISPKVADCVYSLSEELKDRGYVVNYDDADIDVDVVPGKVKVEVNNDFEMSKNEEHKKYDSFKVLKVSPLFELANVAKEIVNQEAKYCNFEYVGFMLFYPRYDIDKKSVGAGDTASKIYIIGDRITNKKLYIAVRSCAIPPGF